MECKLPLQFWDYWLLKLSIISFHQNFKSCNKDSLKCNITIIGKCDCEKHSAFKNVQNGLAFWSSLISDSRSSMLDIIGWNVFSWAKKLGRSKTDLCISKWPIFLVGPFFQRGAFFAEILCWNVKKSGHFLS